MYYVYILKCSDGTFYTGCTKNLKMRLKVHNAGQGAKYTRGRLPVELKYWEICRNRSRAQIREYEIKQYSREKKEELIACFS